MASNKKRVMIIGGGWAGLALAKQLDAEKNIDLTVIDARDGFMLHKFGALRASVQGKDWLHKVLIPTKHTLKHGKIVKGKVVKVNDMDKTAILESGEIIPFDVVVIATGARNLSPGEPPVSVKDVPGTQSYYRAMGESIEKANDIVVYGAGLVGIELCGEILARYPKKRVVLVNGRQHQLAGGVSLSASQVASIRKMLTRGNMLYINDDDITSPELPKDNLADAIPLVEVGDRKVKLASGRSVEADLVIMCWGGRLSTFGVFPNGWLSIQTGELKINQETFQVQNSDFAFAFGDVAATAHEKLGAMHAQDASVVAANVKLLLAGKKPTRRASNARGELIISFGDRGGKTIVSGFPIFGNWLTRTVKSSDLFVSYGWKLYAPGVSPSKYRWQTEESH